MKTHEQIDLLISWLYFLATHCWLWKSWWKWFCRKAIFLISAFSEWHCKMASRNSFHPMVRVLTDVSTLFVVFLSNYKIVFISNYNILFISNYKIVFLSPCNFVEWHSNDIPRTINNKEVEVWQVWKQKYQNRRSLHTCVGQNPQNWNLLELFILRILVGWIPQISCLVDRAYWHFIQAWDVVWILHIHIPYTWLRIRLSSQTATDIKNMKRLFSTAL